MFWRTQIVNLIDSNCEQVPHDFTFSVAFLEGLLDQKRFSGRVSTRSITHNFYRKAETDREGVELMWVFATISEYLLPLQIPTGKYLLRSLVFATVANT